MITIKRIEIYNYRSCLKTKIDLPTNLTTLIGINGVGKSNIMNSIQLLKRISRNRYFHQKHLRDELTHTKLVIKLDIDEQLFVLKSNIFYETDETNTEEIFIAELKLKNLSKNSRKWLDIDPELYEYINYLNRTNKSVNISRAFPNADPNELAVRLVSYLTNISYYSATQFSDPTKCPISLELEDTRLVKSFRKNRTHEQFIYDLYKTYSEEKVSFNRYLNTMNQKGMGLIKDITFIERIIPSNSYKVKAGGQIQKINKTKKIIIPSIVIENLKLSPNQLSEGTFKTLALVFYILYDECDLLLIEEPEVCVHHGLLSSIIELIKTQSKYKQIIVSTHSDYVLDKLQPENVVLIKKYSQKGTIGGNLTQSLSKNDFRALKEYLKYSGNLGEYWKEGGFGDE